MAFTRSIALFAGLVLAASSAQGATILGGYTQKNATSDDIELLTQATSSANMYNKNVDTRICLIAIENLETQTVAGTNYKFQVAGCPVETDDELGACDDRNCDYSSYNIVIFSQPWNDTIEVTSITPAEYQG
uniref:Extracellular cystatin-like protease inhibitor n=1 Tax=Phytophthora mirabilis TaxID=129356 RepID=W8PWZ1_PHYMI|nr:extracellular cystatin-like protease inhibitor [Phytophthora mirabilis]